jgi:hypothetical protein
MDLKKLKIEDVLVRYVCPKGWGLRKNTPEPSS